MDLENFVTQTLSQISKGIQQAQQQVSSTGAWINPAGANLPHLQNGIELTPDIYAYVQNVEFDVAVTVGNNQSAEGGAGLNVLSVKIGASGTVSYDNEQVSRVKFVVPVVWPQSTREDRERAREEAARKALETSRTTVSEVYAAMQRI